MKPRPSSYNGAILKKFVVSLKDVKLLRHQLGRSKEEEGLRYVGSFAKAGKWAVGFRLLLANR